MYRIADALILTCEHASSNIPANYREQLRIPERVLQSHRAYDIGAREIAGCLAKKYQGFLATGKYSRLLIDLNRSLRHPDCFSPYSQKLSSASKQSIIDSIYLPYRNSVEAKIDSRIASLPVMLHLSIHSFTPKWKNKPRSCDIGLLYDPQRHLERDCALEMRRLLKNILPGNRIRCNYPYKGISDGFTRYLRTRYSADKYIGIEVEINQGKSQHAAVYCKALISVISEILEKYC